MLFALLFLPVALVVITIGLPLLIICVCIGAIGVLCVYPSIGMKLPSSSSIESGATFITVAATTPQPQQQQSSLSNEFASATYSYVQQQQLRSNT